MSNPNISVATGALRQEASVWDRNADTLQALVAKVESLRLSRLEAGVFQLLVDAYSKVVDVISGRCREGNQCADEIALALRRVADVYDTEEAANLHALMNLY